MRDISARELKGHSILAVERFQDSTRWMIEFSVYLSAPPMAVPAMKCVCFSQRTATSCHPKPAAEGNQNQAVCPYH